MSSWKSTGVKGGVIESQKHRMFTLKTTNVIPETLPSSACSPDMKQLILTSLIYASWREWSILRTKKNSFLMLSLSVGYLEEIRDANQNPSSNIILANICFQNNVLGTGGSHHIKGLQDPRLLITGTVLSVSSSILLSESLKYCIWNTILEDREEKSVKYNYFRHIWFWLFFFFLTFHWSGSSVPR